MENIKKIAISVVLIGAFSGLANADAIFTPLNFEDSQYTSTNSATKIAADTSSIRQSQPATPAVSVTTGSKNMQSAISELDNAQVEVRNELLNYKTKYSEVDAKYNTIKTERSNLAKQIRECERKIRRLDNAKEKIRRNMVTQ